MRYNRHVFVCTNQRPEGHPRGCCRDKGSESIRDRLKEELKRRGLLGKIRPNNSGCLDACEFGPSIVVYPDNIWYGGVTIDDVEEIVEKHLIGDMPIERLRIHDSRYSPDLFVIDDIKTEFAEDQE